jgi:hypothetical protein
VSCVYSKFSEEIEGSGEQNEYRKNPKTNFMLSVEKTKVNRTSNEEMGGKCDRSACQNQEVDIMKILCSIIGNCTLHKEELHNL